MAGITSKIKKALGIKSKNKSSFLSVGKSYHFGQEDRFNDYKSFLDAGAGNVWASFRACDIVANAVMQTGFNLINEKTGSFIENDRTGISDLMKSPNPVDTFEDLMYLYVHHIKLTGNFFLLKDKINQITKQPEEIYPLIPSRVKIIPDDKNDGRVLLYQYTVNGELTEFSPEEVIHFKRPNPTNEYWGLGDVQAGKGLYKDYINRDLLNEHFQKNGGLPSGVLVNEEFDGEEGEWERVKSIWSNQYAGKKNLGKIAWLTGKWNFIKLGMTSEQMQQIERDRQNVHQIFLNHGVPLSIAGIDKAANYATSRQDYINFKRFTCYPLALGFFRKLNKELVNFYNDDYKIDFVVNGLVDGEAVVREYLPLLAQGAITPNEIRDMAGLPKIDNPLLDSFYINTQLIPMEMVGLANAFGEVPSELLENQVEAAGGDPNRLADDAAAEATSSIDENLLRLRKPRRSNAS